MEPTILDCLVMYLGELSSYYVVIISAAIKAYRPFGFDNVHIYIVYSFPYCQYEYLCIRSYLHELTLIPAWISNHVWIYLSIHVLPRLEK